MDDHLFNKFRQLIYEVSGIHLSDQKKALVVGRLSKRIRELGIDNFKAYYDYVVQDKTGREIVKLIDFISTNVTHFFRESDHFDFLKEKLIEWKEEGQTRFRIWSSACSTGEEPYTIAITAMEALNSTSIDLKILATDISTRVLEKAQSGIYESDKVDQIPNNYKNVFFEELNEDGKKLYKIKPIVKDTIVFGRINLANPPFPMRGPFDAVFCRNVMIYFDSTTRHNLLEEIYRLLKPNGLLFVGHAESLIGLSKGFKAVRPSIYIRL